MPKPKDIEKQRYMFTDDIKYLQKAVIFHPKNKDLFLGLKRSVNSFSRPNDWDLAGGNVLFGELHEDSLRKEVREETGLEVGILHPVQIITNYDKNKKIYYIFNGFYCRAKGNKVRIGKEHSEYKWLTEKEFIDLKPAQYLIDLVKATLRKQ